MNFGVDLLVVDEQGDWAFVQSQADGYCGWLRTDALGPAHHPITHRISTPATHIYPEANMKLREIGTLSLGARLSVIAPDRVGGQVGTDEMARLHVRGVSIAVLQGGTIA